jgi:hypothetical protein
MVVYGAHQTSPAYHLSDFASIGRVGLDGVTAASMAHRVGYSDLVSGFWFWFINDSRRNEGTNYPQGRLIRAIEPQIRKWLFSNEYAIGGCEVIDDLKHKFSTSPLNIPRSSSTASASSRE